MLYSIVLLIIKKILYNGTSNGTSDDAKKKKSRKSCDLQDSVAEREGFEPPEALTSTVFKTAAIDHSAISPKKYVLSKNVFVV